ncbi:PAS domain S-box protein [Occallatibacter savannae]|uniref:PAS domain S-box protein n=1 Tax=Occallatibacter savannae TaxID=1002691 RepID=UPI000D689189|nr:PAS domain S-box protein [Occallatibacter savannae]
MSTSGQQRSFGPNNPAQILLHGASDLLSSPQLEQVLPKVLKLADAVLKADAYAIWRADATQSHWHTVAAEGLSGDYEFRIDLASPRGMSERPIVAPDVQASAELSSRSTVYEREGIVSLLAVPLNFAGETRGTLCFYFRKRHVFTEDEVEASSLLGSLAGPAIGTAELYEEQSSERVRLEFLANAGEALASSLDFETTLEKVAQLAVPAIADWCSVYTYSDGKLENIAVAHQDPAKLALAQEYRRKFPETLRPGSPTERLLTLGESGLYPVIPEEILAKSMPDPEQLRAIKELGIRSVIEVPILAQQRVIGMLRLISAESRRIFNERDLRLGEELGRRAGIAIDNARLYQALRAQQVEQKLILDTLPSLVAVVSREQRYLFVNRAYSEWFGVTHDLTGTTIRELVGDTAYEMGRPYIERALAGEKQEYEAEVPFIHGGTRHIRAVYLPRRTEASGNDGYVAFISDVTAERRILEEMRSSEERFRGIFTNASVPMVVTELDGNIVRANEAYCRLTGYTEEELRKTTFQKLTHPDDLGHNVELYQQLMSGKIPSFTLEKRYIRKDGEIVWIRAGTNVLPDKAGRPRQLLGMGEDITARKVAEIQRNLLMAELEKERAELSSTVEQLQMIEDAVGAGTWYFDVKTGISHWPAGISKLWGLAAERHEIRLDEFASRIHADDLGRVQATIQESLESKKSYEVNFRVLWPDGSVHWLAARGAVVCDQSGEATGILGIALEATERVKTEEALRQSEKLAATGRLAATMAHEINNPLEAVTNLLFLCQQDPALAQHLRGYLEQAEQELGRVSHITRQTLGFYRESVNPQDVNVSDAVREVLELYKYRLSSKNIQVDLRVEPQAIVFARAGEIRQVISNILLNAVDAVASRGTICVRLRRKGEGGVRLMVADNGPGIPAENRRRLFQPFFTTKKDVGTGLGLWVSKGIVEKLNGTIRVRSGMGERNRGTTFIVDLPDLPKAESDTAGV